MNITLYTGPSRCRNLHELLRRTPVGHGRLCALVPDPRSAMRFERMAAETNGGAALGLRVGTFDRLARMVAAMNGSPPDRLPSHLRSALIREIVRSRIGERSSWREVSALPGFAAEVGVFLEDIRSGRGDASHHHELAAIARAYESHLARLDLTDHEGLLEKALDSDAPERFAQAFDGPFIVEGFYDLTPNQLELMTRLARAFRRSAVAVAWDTTRPALFSLAGELRDRILGLGAKEIVVPDDTDTPLSRIRAVFTGGTDTPRTVPDGGGLEVHTFRTERAEADWIGGTIGEMLATGGIRADDILVVTRHRPAPHDPLFTACAHHGVPMEDGTAMRLDAHPLVRCILDALVAASMHDEDRITLVCQSAYTFPGTVRGELDGFDSRGWTSMLAETDSPEGYVDSLHRIIDEIGITDAVEGEPDPVLRKRDTAALKVFGDILGDFGRFYRPVRPMMNAREFVRLFSRFLSDAPMVVSESDASGVVVTELNHARYIERRIVFLTGLGNQSYPAGHDRFSLHAPGTAASIRDHADREEPLLFHLAGDGAERLICTYPGIDDEGSDAGMSPYLRELMNLAGPSCVATVHTGVPGAAWECGPVSARGQLEMVVRRIGATGHDVWPDVIVAQGGSPFADIFARYRLANGDGGISLNRTDAVEALRAVWGVGCPVSVTALELYRSCPIQFWYRQVLGLEQERISPDRLDGRERGIIMHDALAEFYQQRREQTGTARFTTDDLPVVTAHLERIVDERFERMRHDLARLHPLVVQTERQMLKSWLGQVLAAEAGFFSRSSFAPERFEQSFGTDERGSVVIGDGDSAVSLRGRIDRIDVTGDVPPLVRVVDYKTGAKTSQADIRNGTALQLPLYMDAVSRILPDAGEVTEGCYYNLREAGYDTTGDRLTGCIVLDGDTDAAIAQARSYACEAATGIRAGQFPAPGTCVRTCGWRTVCRNDLSRERANDADIKA